LVQFAIILSRVEYLLNIRLCLYKSVAGAQTNKWSRNWTYTWLISDLIYKRRKHTSCLYRL